MATNDTKPGQMPFPAGTFVYHGFSMGYLYLKFDRLWTTTSEARDIAHNCKLPWVYLDSAKL